MAEFTPILNTSKHELIGKGATIRVGSDSYPCTIYDASYSGKTLFLREDDAVRTDSNGLSEIQEYDYSPNPNGREWKATLRKDGRYRISKSDMPVSVGMRRRYNDPSF